MPAVGPRHAKLRLTPHARCLREPAEEAALSHPTRAILDQPHFRLQPDSFFESGLDSRRCPLRRAKWFFTARSASSKPSGCDSMTNPGIYRRDQSRVPDFRQGRRNGKIHLNGRADCTRPRAEPSSARKQGISAMAEQVSQKSSHSTAARGKEKGLPQGALEQRSADSAGSGLEGLHAVVEARHLAGRDDWRGRCPSAPSARSRARPP